MAPVTRLMLLWLLLSLLPGAGLQSQTCTGSLGDPIVHIDFGSGSGFGPPLAAGTTSSLQHQAATCPADGYYSILNYTTGCWPGDVVWHTSTDHTANVNGYYMLVNASSQSSNFYIQTIDGLCEGTSYKFAAWLLNMCSVTGIKPNITFTIESPGGDILATYTTGDLPIVNPVTWEQYGFFFTTPAAVSSVILRIRNNAPGGIGNDLGLDDITFSPAGPAIDAGISGYATDTAGICAGDTTSLELVSMVESCFGTTSYQWQLSNDNGLNWNAIPGATGATFTRRPTVPGRYLYRLTVAEAINIGIPTCRVASHPITVHVAVLPETSVGSNSPKCSGNQLAMNAGFGNSYAWRGPNGFTGSGQLILVNDVQVAHAGMYYVTVTNLPGCSKTDSTLVEINPSPHAMFTPATPACEQGNLFFTSQVVDFGSPVVHYNWNFGDGAVVVDDNPSHVFTATGVYPVSLSVENEKGCMSNTFISDIVVHASPRAGFGLPGICLADPYAIFTDSSSIADSSESEFQYAWDFGDVNATAANPNTSTVQHPRHVYSSTGSYPVQLTVTSRDGCSSDTVKNFTINGSRPVANFNIGTGVNFCSNMNITLTDASTVNSGSITRTEIFWDNENNPLVKTSYSLPGPAKNYDHRYPVFGEPLTKMFTIRYQVYSGINCVNEVRKVIIMKAAPALNFTAFAPLCEEAPGRRLSQARETNGLVGSGGYSGPGVSGGNFFDPRMATAGLHSITYDYLASNGCTSTATQPMRVYPQPLVDAGPDRTVLPGGFVVPAATASGNALQYTWTPGTGINNTAIVSPTVMPLENSIYTLEVVSADGCRASDQLSITVMNDIYVPTAFSPNGDGLNDTWRIPYIESYPGAVVEVYNRFGRVVYRSAGNATGWDGRYNGQPLPLASYTWILHPGNERKLKVGSVTIVH